MEANSYIVSVSHTDTCKLFLHTFTVKCSDMQYLLRQLMKTAVITNLQNILYVKMFLTVKKKKILEDTVY